MFCKKSCIKLITCLSTLYPATWWVLCVIKNIITFRERERFASQPHGLKARIANGQIKVFRATQLHRGGRGMWIFRENTSACNSRMRQLCHNHAQGAGTLGNRARKIANHLSGNPPLFAQLFRAAKRRATRKKRPTHRDPRKLIYLTGGVLINGRKPWARE